MEATKETEIWHKGSLEGEDDARTSNTRISQRKCAIPHMTMKNITCFRRIDMTCAVVMALWTTTCVVVTVLCNQPEAFASDLGDDLGYLLLSTLCIILASVVQIHNMHSHARSLPIFQR